MKVLLYLIILIGEGLTFYADFFSNSISKSLWELIRPFDNKNPTTYFSYTVKDNVTEKLFHDILDSLLGKMGNTMRSKVQIETYHKAPSKDDNLFFNVIFVDCVEDVR